MAVKQVPQIFKTSDSEEFDSQDDAERHEAVLTAKEIFETAAREYGEAMLGEAVTADGERFDLALSCQYYYIAGRYGGGMPRLQSTYFYRWNCCYDLRGGLTITQRQSDSWQACPVKELYRHKTNAERALIVAQRERIREFTEQVDEEEKKLG